MYPQNTRKIIVTLILFNKLKPFIFNNLNQNTNY